jgi:endonuclease YncB( thermonuclease family)
MGPFLISALVVTGFGFRAWLVDPTIIRPQKGATLACELGSVIDGDTLEAVCEDGRMRVRLWGMDAPEMLQTPWGALARSALTRFVASGDLSIQVIDHDRYGRVVARVFSARRDVGLKLVREGFAPVPLKYVRDGHYRSAQDTARREKQGVWRVPGAQQRPWEWRKFNPRPGKAPR